MTEHEQKYEALCEKHGVAWDKHSPKLVDETLDSLRAKYAEDEHLNNVPLKLWDALAFGFSACNPGHPLSLSEGVCMQKHAAKKLLGVMK